VVTAQAKQSHVFVQYIPRVLINSLGHLLGSTRVEVAITDINNREVFEWVEVPSVHSVSPGHNGGCGANSPGSQSRARAVGGSEIVGHACYGNVYAGKVSGVAAAQEAGDSGISRLFCHPIKTFTGDSEICQFFSHERSVVFLIYSSRQ